MIKRICKICSKDFWIFKCRIKRKYSSKYCSIKCLHKGLKGQKRSKETKRKIGLGHKGMKFSKEQREKISKNHADFSGSKNPNWKDGRVKRNGYIFIYMPEHPFAHKKYVQEHHLVMEKMLGRYMKFKERAHHINRIKDDNRPENLKYFPNESKHQTGHCKKR